MRALPLVIAALLLSACQSADQPLPTQLHGVWGAFDIEVRDSSEGKFVWVRMAWRASRLSGPVAVDADGRFSAEARALGLNRDAANITGRVFTDSLTVAVYAPGGPQGELSAAHFTVYPRQYGNMDMTGYGCAA